MYCLPLLSSFPPSFSSVFSFFCSSSYSLLQNSVCVCVCVCVCVYVYGQQYSGCGDDMYVGEDVSGFKYLYVNPHTRSCRIRPVKHTHTHTHSYTEAHTHSLTHIPKHTHTHSLIYPSTHTHTLTHSYTQVHTHTHSYTQAHTHTHTIQNFTQ